MVEQTDILIVGSGIAGAAAALRLSDNPSVQVMVITRAANPNDANTHWAQGGIVVRGLDDSPELLVQDILNAGAGISDADAAWVLAREGSGLVHEVLIERCGVNFDRDPSGDYAMGLEGAHSTRRVIHAGDKTGAEIMRGLLAELQRRPNITLLTDHTALDLIVERGVCAGAWVLHRTTEAITPILAGATILATGGVGQVFAQTSNPAGARGDGLAMAIRAGAQVAHAEYVQFHPTTIPTGTAQNLLVSEAVRGEGAVLRTVDGAPFMERYAPKWRDLAPRDVVARAIQQQMAISGSDHVLLDIASQRPADFIRERFPQLVENAQTLGLDPTRDPIPVAPAAHYFCGGVRVDHDGLTSLHRLYAVGEVSCTGLHGANRLASTSLLEGLVWGDRAARHILNTRPRGADRVPVKAAFAADRPLDDNILARIDQHIKRIMSEHVGLVRDERGLRTAEQELAQLAREVRDLTAVYQMGDALNGSRSRVVVAQAITAAARQNRMSRGAHYRRDAVMIAAG